MKSPIHVWKGSIYSFTQARKTFYSVVVLLADFWARNLGSILGPVCHLIRWELWKTSLDFSLFRITSILVAIVVMYIVLVSPSEIFRFVQSFLIQKQFHLRDSEVLSTINEVRFPPIWRTKIFSESVNMMIFFKETIHFLSLKLPLPISR